VGVFSRCFEPLYLKNCWTYQNEHGSIRSSSAPFFFLGFKRYLRMVGRMFSPYCVMCIAVVFGVAVVLLSLLPFLLVLVVVDVCGPRVTLLTWLRETRRKETRRI